MYNLIEHSDNFSKIYGSLWQYYRDEPFFKNNAAVADFSVIMITIFRLNLKQI